MLTRTFAFAVLFAGCVEGPGSRPGAAWAEGERDSAAALTTDSLWYVARRMEEPNPYGRTDAGPWYLLEVAARFLNVTPDTVVLRAVDGRPLARLALVSRDGTAVEDPLRQPAYGLDPGPSAVWRTGTVAVPPGNVRVDTLRLWGPDEWRASNLHVVNNGQGVWAPGGPMVGRMRLTYEQEGYRRPDSVIGWRIYAPPSALTSNAFEVRLNDPIHLRPITGPVP